ncbi:MAG: QueT transporter family protein [Clostridia bacterium]|nr:QueT transporter family protein [Clostridia bacterium]
MKNFLSTKRLCRAGVIAALYAVLTYVFGALSHNGFVQIRPAEALCILPLFYVEAILALYVGCMIANLTSPFAVYDVLLGSLATLLAALLTYFIGKLFKKDFARVAVGGIPPIVINALFIPVIIVFLCGDISAANSPLAAYFAVSASLAATQSVWVYALGLPLYFLIKRLREKGVAAFCDLPLKR